MITTAFSPSVKLGPDTDCTGIIQELTDKLALLQGGPPGVLDLQESWTPRSPGPQEVGPPHCVP